MINHSCQPNVAWSFEGKELRVIAINEIPAGDEVFFSYVDDLGDYHRRRRLLSERWGITCVCSLCAEGPKGLSSAGPGKPFGDRILALKEKPWPQSPEELVIVQRALEAFHDAGYGPEAYPMRWFYRCLWAAETLKGAQGLKGALKLCLKVFYLVSKLSILTNHMCLISTNILQKVEPDQNPLISADERLDTLFHLINHLMNLPVSTIPGLDIAVVVTRLRYQRFLGIQKAFGKDAALAVFEHQDPPSEDIEDFVANMRLLLTWAGLTAVRDKQLIGCLGNL